LKTILAIYEIIVDNLTLIMLLLSVEGLINAFDSTQWQNQ